MIRHQGKEKSRVTLLFIGERRRRWWRPLKANWWPKDSSLGLYWVVSTILLESDSWKGSHGCPTAKWGRWRGLPCGPRSRGLWDPPGRQKDGKERPIRCHRLLRLCDPGSHPSFSAISPMKSPKELPALLGKWSPISFGSVWSPIPSNRRLKGQGPSWE